jgi:F0F1-type ATP synthase membrane subunit b/b'
MERERAADEMKKSVIEISSAIAAKFLTKSIDADEHEKLFNETLAELEGIAWHS